VLVALLEKFKVPEAEPVAVGLKIAVNEAEPPGAIVSGRERPLMENSEFVPVIEEIVTEAPVAVSVPVWLPVVPTTTFPKVRAEGESASWPGAVPDPERLTDNDGLAALEATASDPLAAPVDDGAKVTLNVTLCPGLRVVGGFTPLMLNPAPLGTMVEMVMAEPPELVSFSDNDLLDPVATLPKLKVAGVALTDPGVTAVAESPTLRVLFEAVLTIARLPLAVPAEVGENITDTVAL